MSDDLIELADSRTAGGVAADPLRLDMDKRVDLAVSLVVVATGALICYLASSFRTGSFPDPVTARGLPYFTGGFMMIAGTANAARRVLTWSLIPGPHAMGEGAPDENGHPASASRAFAIAALALVWAGLLHKAGFLLITPLVLFGMLWLMNVRSLRKLVAFPLCFTLVIWIAFSQILSIILPLGPLTTIARSWGLTP